MAETGDDNTCQFSVGTCALSGPAAGRDSSGKPAVLLVVVVLDVAEDDRDVEEEEKETKEKKREEEG